MAVNVLGRAYIEVHADTKAFARELLADVTAISKIAEKSARTNGEKIGRELGDGVERSSSRAGRRVAGTLYRAIGRELFRVGRNGRLFNVIGDGIVDDAARVGRKAGASFASLFLDGLGNVGSGLGKFVSSIGSSVGNVGSAGPLAGIIGGAILVLIPGLIGAILGLVSALGSLLNVVGLLPGALAILLGSILPVVVAFQHFGEAIGAIMSGDPEKIAEAFKALSPAARAVAQDVAKLMPLFKAIQQSTQNAFFAQLVGVLPKVMKVLEPILKGGFEKVAAAAGQFAQNFLLMANDPAIQSFLKNLFSLSADMFKILGPPLISLLSALATIADASFPAIKELSVAFGGMIQQFANFLTNAVASGDFDKFLDDFVVALRNLGDLLKSGFNLLDALMGGPDEQASAEEFFDMLVFTIDTLADFFRSDVGREALQGMLDIAKLLLVAFLGVVAAFSLIIAAIEKVIDLLRQVVVIAARIDPFNILPDVPVAAGPGSFIRPINKSGSSFGRAPGHAAGGIFDSEHIARVAEGGRREVIIPLTDPDRARELADRSGLSSIMNNDVMVNVYIGDEQIQARVDKRVAAGINGFARSLHYGPRPIGVGG